LKDHRAIGSLGLGAVRHGRRVAGRIHLHCSAEDDRAGLKGPRSGIEVLEEIADLGRALPGRLLDPDPRRTPGDLVIGAIVVEDGVGVGK
jgi:hypothetical protein